MWYKSYGKTEKRISVVSFGAMRFANPEDIEGSAKVVLHAHRRGINYFDTAPGYCKDKSEDIVGAAVKQMKPGTFYVSTKSMAADGGELRKSLERSLTRLNVPTINFFHIWCLVRPEHWQQRVDGGAVAAALKAREEGLIEHLVVSSHLPGSALRQVLQAGVVEGVTLGYCALNAPYRQEAVDAAGKMSLGVVTMNPLGGGVIPQNARRFACLQGPGDPSVVAGAIRFNVSQRAVTSALVGFSSISQVDEACDAVDNFMPYDSSRLESIRRQLGTSIGPLCTGCGYCLPCPAGVAIPKMMDAFNMRILQGTDPKNIKDRLKWHWHLAPADAQTCTLCGACEQRCTQSLPIRERLREIAALKE